MCIGFLSGLEKEVERFKSYVSALDTVVNPHRYDSD